MSTEKLDEDRRKLQSILHKLQTGKVTLESGAAEYVASLKRRIGTLSDKLRRKRR